MKRGWIFGIFFVLIIFGFVSFVSSAAGVVIQGWPYTCGEDDNVCPEWYGVDCGEVQDNNCVFGESVVQCEDRDEETCEASGPPFNSTYSTCSPLEGDECLYKIVPKCLWDFNECVTDLSENVKCSQSPATCDQSSECVVTSLFEENKCDTEGIIELHYTFENSSIGCQELSTSTCPETFNLSFFDWKNFVMALAIIVVIYYLLCVSKKKKK